MLDICLFQLLFYLTISINIAYLTFMIFQTHYFFMVFFNAFILINDCMKKYLNINICRITIEQSFLILFYFAFFSRPSYNRLGIIITGLAFDSSQRYFRIIDVNDRSDWDVKERGN